MTDFRFETWPTEFRIINQLFGVNRDFYARFGLPGHEGIDIQAPLGARIFAVAAGRVRVVNTNPAASNYGIHVRIEHADGYETIYGHFQEARVSLNQNVNAGDLLGLAGSTGNSTGPHLHLTLKKRGQSLPGYPENIIDPTPFLLPLLGWREPAGPYTNGWVFTEAVLAFGPLAQANAGGVSLRQAPARNANRIAVVPEGTIMIVNGQPSGEYTPVRVSSVAIGVNPPPPAPTPPPPPTVATIDGWGFATNLIVSGPQAIVGNFGINLRAAPDRGATNIGLVEAGSTVTSLGPVSGEYMPIRVRRADFMGPINLPEMPPVLPPTPTGPSEDTVLGWGATSFLGLMGGRATVTSQFGLNLRATPGMSAPVLGIVKGFASVTVAGLAQGSFTPILARKVDILNLVSPLPAVTPPTPLPGTIPTPPPPQPIHDTTPGWAFTAGIAITGQEAIAGPLGINLRAEPRRDATMVGFVPAGATMIVTGPPQGEYTPVRVDDDVIQLVSPGAAAQPTPPINPDPPLIGQTRLGLHASADPGDLREAEFAEFAATRPGIIKVLSAHSGASIARLAAQHAGAAWIVRAFLSFRGGRVVRPNQFVNDTIGDVERALNALQGKEVVIELHNEPNLLDEGLGGSWADGGAFGAWLGEVLSLYRQRLPGQRFIYPGLSPGPSVPPLKQDHRTFIEASRAAVEAADGLGVHLYWSQDPNFPMPTALAVLDDYVNRFQNRPIWVTEASNNKPGATPQQKGQQYLQFWTELKRRPNVRGVTYFVASATDPTFDSELWVGRGIGAIVGQR
ncbi:MAG: M23 family metallopeptidase [Chloroflexi bacterium]|nr:M23 family metallopeptidase [Chloroflexota bacterium]MCI0579503.1 M23 family metallopeptidase [Chloroflexota bacterium]MCI0650206.1 M23 family metallopeptidase [Chloroflexota bacterium]MCI0729483.1 M23 family metallopeptidase [Chloroflexota bacterium]